MREQVLQAQHRSWSQNSETEGDIEIIAELTINTRSEGAIVKSGSTFGRYMASSQHLPPEIRDLNGELTMDTVAAGERKR